MRHFKLATVTAALLASVSFVPVASAADLPAPRKAPPPVYYKAPPPAPVYPPQVYTAPQNIDFFAGVEFEEFVKSTQNETVATGLTTCAPIEWLYGQQNIKRSWPMLGGKVGVSGSIASSAFFWIAQAHGDFSLRNSNIWAGVINESSSTWKAGGEGGVGYRWGDFDVAVMGGVEHQSMTATQSYQDTTFPEVTVTKNRPTVAIQARWFVTESLSLDGLYRHGFDGQAPTNGFAAALSYHFGAGSSSRD